MIKEIIFIIALVIMIVSCLAQFKVFMLCEAKNIDLDKKIDNKFNELYGRQSKFFSNKYWSEIARNCIYIDKQFLQNIDYNRTPKQIYNFVESYLKGYYDEEISDVLGNYTIKLCERLKTEEGNQLREECIKRAVFVDKVSYTDKFLCNCFDEGDILNQNIFFPEKYDCLGYSDWEKMLNIYLSASKNPELFPKYKDNLPVILHFLIDSRFFEGYSHYSDNQSKVELENLLIQRSLHLVGSLYQDKESVIELLLVLSKLMNEIVVNPSSFTQGDYILKGKDDTIYLSQQLFRYYNANEIIWKNLLGLKKCSGVYTEYSYYSEDAGDEDLMLF